MSGRRLRLVLFDDATARDWRPFTLTRPVGELLFGTATLRSRAEHRLDADCVGHITSTALADFDEPWAPSVLEPGDLDPADGCVFLLSRFVPEPGALPDHPALLISGGQVVGCVVGPGDAPPDPSFFVDPETRHPDLPPHELPGAVLGNVWELMSGNAERVARDLEGIAHAALSPDVHHVGEHPVAVGADVRIAPGVVLDTRDGPIRLGDGVVVQPFTRLVGPSYVGHDSTLLGGPFDAVSIGPVCKVHGELEESVILGYSNKAHDGFIGHAYLGMWVNLGALTTNSDLKNNYGNVRIWTPDGERDTGSRKIGCFLGDHVKTAIGTMINTGTVIEAGSNIFGGMPPKHVPPFSWGGPDAVYEVDRFLETAAIVMDRRDVVLTDRQRALLRSASRQRPGNGSGG